MNTTEIYEWLKAQKYQTEREDTGEYLMYFELDMPRILEDYYKWRVSKTSSNPVLVENLTCPHLYSKSMNQPYPRKCVKCGEVEK